MRTTFHPDISSCECEVCYKASRTILHEDTNLVVTADGGHDKVDILQTGRLSNLPMDTGWVESLIAILDDRRHGRDVDDKIADLAIEVVLVDVPFRSISSRNVEI